MNKNISTAVRRLNTIFISLLLSISVVAAYVQVSDRAFFNGPVLAESQTFNARGHCPPYDAPVRGTIYDRNGVKLAWSVQDPNATCGYRRQYLDPTLSPLIGYFSYKYGTAGIESTYNDWLSGTQTGTNSINILPHLLHEPQYGNDLYLTIDERLQKEVNSVYNSSALFGGVCQSASDPNGAVVVENPSNGEILAMVSHPYYDANRIDESGYFAGLQSDGNLPLLNRATQGSYPPGSTFKTVTLSGVLNEGIASLSTSFSQQDAVYFTVNGEHINWDDYLNGQWQNAQFPLSLQDAYAYSDNSVYAREAVALGGSKWLDYVRRFGVETPGQGPSSFAAPSFDAPFTPSQAFNATSNGSPTAFTDNLLAESGFGQGQLQISPLTMVTVASAVGADGDLYTPHVVYKKIPYGATASGVLATPAALYQSVMAPQTAAAVRQAMWAVSQYGTGSAGLGPHNGYYVYNSPAHMGGKTGTAQLPDGRPHAWWIGIAPDDASGAGTGPAKYAIALIKEHSGEGACQAYVANDVMMYAMQHSIGY
ncbi:MAG TPA: penicillin-binding transpeptidase domain-containing protein [Ktedonobacterales bacterium]